MYGVKSTLFGGEFSEVKVVKKRNSKYGTYSIPQKTTPLSEWSSIVYFTISIFSLSETEMRPTHTRDKTDECFSLIIIANTV